MGRFIVNEERLASRARKIEYEIESNGCWTCVSHAKNKTHGYKIERSGLQMIMHRHIYELFNSCKIEEGVVIRHKCDNGYCINPNHLELGTHQDNVQDRVERGRSALGSNNGRSKLSEDNVVFIRMNITNSQTELSKMFDVDRTVIRDIWNGKKWKHVLQDIDYKSFIRKNDSSHRRKTNK